jgi:hypothetical protein
MRIERVELNGLAPACIAYLEAALGSRARTKKLLAFLALQADICLWGAMKP